MTDGHHPEFERGRLHGLIEAAVTVSRVAKMAEEFSAGEPVRAGIVLACEEIITRLESENPEMAAATSPVDRPEPPKPKVVSLCACSCATLAGRCEHVFTGSRDLVDSRGRVCGSTLVCARCQLSAADHDWLKLP